MNAESETSLDIRDVGNADLAAVLSLNEAVVPAVNSIDGGDKQMALLAKERNL